MTDTLPFRILMLLPDEDSSISSPDKAVALARGYYLLRDSGLEVAFASRLGGFSAISAEMRRVSDRPAVARMLADQFARDELSDAIPLASVFVEDFDALVLFVEDSELAQREIVELMSEFEASKKKVVSPGPATSVDDRWPREITDAARRQM